ncbi:MAG: DUF3341 domain-containing protein [Myxococcota bacterium]|nr:DUF3341 domain-containing protein [Myxococcota bacterium]
MRSGADISSGVVGTFAHVDLLVEAVKKAKARRLDVVDVFSPVPVESIAHLISPKKSPVRFVTFLGGLSGLVGGLALGILTAMIWNIVVGGKPVTSHVPFVVVAFEGMILLGALATFAALLLFGRLPFTKFPGKAYQSEFSLDRFGLCVGCRSNEVDDVTAFLTDMGAVGVRRLDDEKGAAR